MDRSRSEGDRGEGERGIGRLPPLVHNRLSYAGTAIAVVSFALIALLFVAQSLRSGPAPYGGLVTFIVLPVIMLGGLFLIPIGMALEWRLLRRTGGRRPRPAFPVLDLNKPPQRNAALIFAVITVLLLVGSVLGSFKAYEATESVAFCGTTCHTPMEPEYTTYRNSPHARVRCVECHVGPGADWYVKSKFSGMYQLYAVAFDKFPRPIPGTIERLRPAQATCEQCHWPAKFFGSQQVTRVHYLSDEQNTRWEISLLIKTGGTTPLGRQGQGIHWHMNIDNRVEYIATDRNRQEIPWVRVTNKATGVSRIYASTDKPLSPEQIAAADVRTMDCMDCHNRPSHILRSPRESMDRALQLEELEETLPSIVDNGIKLLKADYPSVSDAEQAIERGITNFYRERYPELAKRRSADVARTVAGLKQIYRDNFFPTMKSRWDAYPSNIGHIAFPGCMRCHDGSHQSDDGKVISRACDTCHEIIGQGKNGDLKFSTQPGGLPFEHPEDVGDSLDTMQCTDCHAGE
jgi:nitrate/TMAO reductase-like tetraheme cytochrome c subunit